MAQTRTAQPTASLTVADAVALIVGVVVGAGIFRTPSLVAGAASSPGVVLLAWTVGGAISLVGALSYAELTAAYPHAGGDYHYLSRAIGPRVGLLFAWSRIAVIQSGSIAMQGFIVGDYATRVLPLGPWSVALYAALAVSLTTGLNAAGLRQGTWAQNVLTTTIVLGLGAVVVTGILLAAPAEAPLPAAPTSASGFGLAMVFVLLTYGGWNEAAYLSAEMRGGPRAIQRALVTSIVLVTALYLLVNLAFLQGLGLAGVAGSDAAAADLMARAFGGAGASFISALVVLAALSTMNASVFTGARTTYALGRAYTNLGALGRWDGRTNAPPGALMIQGAVSLALVGLGAATREGFTTMVEYTAPVFWFFFVLVGISLFVLRRKDPDRPRPFKVPLYPLTPLLFCAAGVWMLWSSLAYTGLGALVGVAVVASGVPLMLVARRGPEGPS